MSKANNIKISIVGDIMCEIPLLRAAKKGGGYSFERVFEHIKKYLDGADYVIGNLETPISNVVSYTNDLYAFNTPENFLKALRNNGFDMLITANNHCLDRGLKGLEQTMVNINKNGMSYVGTRQKSELDNSDYVIVEIDGIKIAFLAYTYGTNYSYNRFPLEGDLENLQVNLLKDQKSNCEWPNYKKVDAYKVYLRCLVNDYEKRIKDYIKLLIKYQSPSINTDNSIVVDHIGQGEWNISDKKMNCIKQSITKAYEQGDVTCLFMHCGGQFNAEPGSFTKHIVDDLEKTPLDAIIGTHPHVVQKAEFRNGGKMIAYSLGNLSISPSTPYLNHTLLPENSILLNIYIDKDTKKVNKYTFTILKAIEDERHYLEVHLLYDLIQNEKDEQKKQRLIKENLFIYNRFTNKNEDLIELKEEYDFL